MFAYRAIKVIGPYRETRLTSCRLSVCRSRLECRTIESQAQLGIVIRVDPIDFVQALDQLFGEGSVRFELIEEDDLTISAQSVTFYGAQRWVGMVHGQNAELGVQRSPFC